MKVSSCTFSNFYANCDLKLINHIYVTYFFTVYSRKETFELTKDNPDDPKLNGVDTCMDLEVENKPVPPATDVFKFLLPGLCHLTTEETARRVFLEEDGPAKLAQYFSHLVQKMAAHPEDIELEVGPDNGLK